MEIRKTDSNSLVDMIKIVSFSRDRHLSVSPNDNLSLNLAIIIIMNIVEDFIENSILRQFLINDE